MIKLKALKAIDEQDGKFAEGDEFVVNEERAAILQRQGLAEMAPDQTNLFPGVKPAEGEKVAVVGDAPFGTVKRPE